MTELEKSNLKLLYDCTNVNILMENRTNLNESLMSEISALYGKRRNKLRIILVAILAVISIFSFLMRDTLLGVIFAIYTVIIAVSSLFSAKKLVKNLTKQRVEQLITVYGAANVESRIKITTDRIILDSILGTRVYPLTRIQKVYETASCFYIVFKGNLDTVIAKNGFILGTADDFAKMFLPTK